MSPNGLQVVVIDGDRLPRLFHIETGALRLVLDRRGVTAIAFSPGGRLIATASADRTVSSATVAFAQPTLGFARALTVRDPDGHAVQIVSD